MSESAQTILKRTLGVIFVIFGFIAFLVPFFPFAWLAFVGLELLGVRALFWDRIKVWLQKRK